MNERPHDVSSKPANLICSRQYPSGNPAWWYDIVEGLPGPIMQNGLIEVWDRPGMGIEINPERARQYLAEEDTGFFD
jgi:L-alanine-DL-glutamate epimerase-like enolase superfamily enzyme